MGKKRSNTAVAFVMKNVGVPYSSFDQSTAKHLSGPKAPKPYQGVCFTKLKDEIRRILDIPTAAGKSLIAMALATHDAHEGCKVIVATPQLSIARGFRKDHFILPSTGEEIYWEPYEQNFLVDNDESSIKRVIEFLKAPLSHDPNARQLVTTHHTMIAVYKWLKDNKQRKLLRKLSLFVDEGHHANGGEMTSNILGALIRYMTKRASTKVALITATNFRADGLPIAPKDLETYASYELPYDEYLTHKSIGALEFRFNLFTDEPCQDAGRMVRENLDKRERSIIFIPRTNHSFHSNHYGKYTSNYAKMKQVIVDDILVGISAKAHWYLDDEGCHCAKINGKVVRVADLIDEEADRHYTMKHIDDTKKNIENGVDVIIAMDMFKEGSDYPLLQHVIVMEPRNSLGEVIQQLGRVMRDDEKVSKGRYAKNRVSFTYLISAPHENHEQFTIYMNALLQAMLLIDVLEPLLVATEEKPKKSKKDTVNTVPSLSAIFGGIDVEQEIRLKFVEKLVQDGDWGEIEQSERKERTVEFVKNQITLLNVVLPKSITMNDVANQLYSRMVRELVPSRVKAEIIDPDIVYKHDPLTYLCKRVGRKFFRSYRAALEARHGRGLEDAMRWLDKYLAFWKEHGHPRDNRDNTARREEQRLHWWRSSMRKAKQNYGIPTISVCTWFPSLESKADKAGCTDLFQALTGDVRLQKAMRWLDKYLAFWKEHGHPKSGTPLSNWRGNMRKAKSCYDAGKSNTGGLTWYPELESKADKAGCTALFQVLTTDIRVQKALDMVRKVAAFYDAGVKPSIHSKDKDEWRSASFLSHMRKAKQNHDNNIPRKNGDRTWCPECEPEATRLGYPDMLVYTSDKLMNKALDMTRTCLVIKKETGHFPTSSPSSSNRKEGLWLQTQRKIRGKKTNGDTYIDTGFHVIYSECDALAEKSGEPDMFDSPASENNQIASALALTKECIAFQRKHKEQPRGKRTKKEDRLARFIQRMIKASRGLGGEFSVKVTFPKCKKMIVKAGFPDMFTARGKQNKNNAPNTKIFSKDIPKIERLYYKEGLSQVAIGEKFGVTGGAIGYVLRQNQ